MLIGRDLMDYATVQAGRATVYDGEAVQRQHVTQRCRIEYVQPVSEESIDTGCQAVVPTWPDHPKTIFESLASVEHMLKAPQVNEGLTAIVSRTRHWLIHVVLNCSAL